MTNVQGTDAYDRRRSVSQPTRGVVVGIWRGVYLLRTCVCVHPHRIYRVLVGEQEEMSAEYPVVAFLQNCWFRPGTNPETIRLYLSDQKFRRKVLEMSMTGKRLKRAFGEHYRSIWWDNASEYVASTSPGRSEADPYHMARVINQVRPMGMLTFGTVAHRGMLTLRDGPMPITDQSAPTIATDSQLAWHYCHHPNARGLLQSQLNEFASNIISRYF